MRDGICPNCGHDDVRVGKDTMLGEPTTLLGIPITSNSIYSKTVYDVYVCLNCGNVELGLSDEYTLDDIAERWPRATPQAGETK